MKTIIVIITMLLLALDLSVPDNYLFMNKTGQQPAHCSIIYSEDEEAYVYQDSVAHCSIVEIRSLPPLSDGDVQIKARFTKGSYTFKVAGSVGTNVGYDFQIEDMLTGQVFNLKTQPSYNFNVSRTIPDRFVMHVKKSSSVTSK